MRPVTTFQVRFTSSAWRMKISCFTASSALLYAPKLTGPVHIACADMLSGLLSDSR